MPRTTLQAVNPRVSVPYWDYTIDMTNYELSGDIESFYGSVVFSPDFFGSSWHSYHRYNSDDDSGDDSDDLSSYEAATTSSSPLNADAK